MYKKILTIILAIAIVATLGAISVSAVNYPVYGTVESGITFHGGTCYDTENFKSRANAWARNMNAYNSIELEYWQTGQEWFDHGISVGEMADVYSSDVTGYAADTASLFGYYGWCNSSRK